MPNLFNTLLMRRLDQQRQDEMLQRAEEQEKAALASQQAKDWDEREQKEHDRKMDVVRERAGLRQALGEEARDYGQPQLQEAADTSRLRGRGGQAMARAEQERKLAQQQQEHLLERDLTELEQRGSYREQQLKGQQDFALERERGRWDIDQEGVRQEGALERAKLSKEARLGAASKAARAQRDYKAAQMLSLLQNELRGASGYSDMYETDAYKKRLDRYDRVADEVEKRLGLPEGTLRGLMPGGGGQEQQGGMSRMSPEQDDEQLMQDVFGG